MHRFMSQIQTLFALVLVVAVAAPTAGAQDLQSPAEFLGYELGDRFSRHHRVVDYFEHVAENSDRVTLQQYGETYEGRPLMVAFVGTSERVADLESVRRGNMRRAGLAEESVSPGEVPIVWLSYNVHGNESVSTEASMATLYELVRPGGSSDWLDNTLVVIDPCINPDGRDRYANWYNETVGFMPNANPDAREHREPWPGGRTNHYHFDLNRDWAWQSQQESQHRLALYNTWLPQVHVDFHEQGVDSPYYFAPAAEPYHDAITDWQRAFQDSVGTNHARYFDENGWLYFTREVFDLFYPGYGDTYPIFNGGIGMTYEQGGSGRAGLAIETAEGDTLTLADRILHHHTTGLSTVETTSRNAAVVLDEFSRFYTDAVDSPDGTYRSFILKASSGAQRLASVASHLDRLGIRYGTVEGSPRRVSGRDYRSGEEVSGTAEPGDLIVNVRQPKGVLARVLFEPDPRVPDSLTYDITAWALPYAYGLDAIASTSEVPAAAAFSAKPAPGRAASTQPYAYALRWDAPEDVVFLAAALAEGIDARVNTEPFKSSGHEFAAGTVLFTRAGNESLGEAFHARIRSLAREHSVELIPLATGRVLEGSDMGSGRVRFVTAPRVLVATGSPVSSYSAGQVWHWFEQQLGYQVTMVNAEDLGGVDLDEYDVLILPSGSYGRILTDDYVGQLQSWIRNGGRLVAIEGAARSLIGKDGFDLERKELEDEDEDEEPADRLKAYADRTRAGLTENISGAVFRTRVDASHPLGFGMGRGYFSLRRNSTGYEYLEDGWNVGVVEAGSRLSGKVGSEAREGVEESLAFGAQDMGRGSVIYLLDDPLFRAFWYEGRLLMGNAVFLSAR